MIATDADIKTWQTLQARLLLTGFKADLIEADEGRPELLVSKWAMTRRFDDIGLATAWTNLVLGKAQISPPAQDVQAPLNGASRHENRAT